MIFLFFCNLLYFDQKHTFRQPENNISFKFFNFLANGAIQKVLNHVNYALCR